MKPVGVPLIFPVAVLNDNPVGGAVLIAYVKVPNPVLVTTIESKAVVDCPCTNVFNGTL